MLEVLITERLMRKFSEVPAVGNGINNNCTASSYTNDHASVESKCSFQILSMPGLLLHCSVFSRKQSNVFFCMMRINTTPDLQKEGLLWRSQNATLCRPPMKLLDCRLIPYSAGHHETKLFYSFIDPLTFL